MRYARDTTLLPCTPADLRLAERLPFHELPARDLLLYDETVSDFFFEFEPGQEIERFLQHAHFGGIDRGKLVACREDLLTVAALDTGAMSESLALHLTSDLPAPLRFTPDRAAFEAIARGGEYRGRVTVCTCGIAGCFSQYAWVRDSMCLALFTINGASLTEVVWRPFRLAVQAESGSAPDPGGIT